MTILANGMETMDYYAPNWHHIYNKNMELLDRRLLKLAAILEIDTTTLLNGDTISWDEVNLKWVRTAVLV